MVCMCLCWTCLVFVFSLQFNWRSFISAENNHPTYINHHIDIRLLLEGAYKSRGAASAAVHLVIAEGFGKAVALDKKRSGGIKITCVCPSSLDLFNSHDSSTDNIYDELGFDSPWLPNEGKVVYKLRYGHELRIFFIHKNQTGNKTSVCPFMLLQCRTRLTLQRRSEVLEYI